MRTQTFVIFGTYIWTKTLLGLTFHPFTSVRGIIRRPILFPVIFSPIIGLGVLFIVGRIAKLLIETQGADRELIAMFLSTVLLSILFWQALLLYLLGSFLFALKRNQ